MALGIDPSVLFAAVSAVIVLLIAVLAVADYQLKKRKALQHESMEYRYSKRFAALKQTQLSPSEKIESADRFVRDFFAERFGVTGKEDYSKLAEIFASSGKMHIIPFCQTMTEILYSGESVNAADVRSVFSNLESMLKREGIFSAVTEEDENNETDFITRTADIVNKKIDDWKAARADAGRMEKEKKAQSAKSALSEIKKETEIPKLESPEPVPVQKKMIIIPKRTAKRAMKEKKEYRYIGSIDMLDRIEEKVKNRKTAA